MADGFRIYSDNHAIDEFHLRVDFFRSVGISHFQTLLPLVRAAADALGLVKEIKLHTIEATAEGDSVSVEASQGLGIGYQRFSPSGDLEISLQCDGNSITYITKVYPGWTEVSRIFSQHLSPIVEKYLDEAIAVKGLLVSYRNIFIENESGQPADVMQLLRSGSRWIAMGVVSNDTAWHSHVGVYEYISDDERLLYNVNFDVVSNGKRGGGGKLAPVRQVAVTVTVSDRFDVAGSPPWVLVGENLGNQIFEKFQLIHDIEKRTLRECITDRYIELTGCGGG